MPRLDGTGPRGLGPMTGRVLGYCDNVTAIDFIPCCRRGLGFHTSIDYSDKSEKQLLTEHKQDLENRIDAINKKLEIM